jgi:hypothetical protein
MIVTCLNGGLGNQMFQYAAARSLADRLGESLELDIRDLQRPPFGFLYPIHPGRGIVRDYGLGCYPLRAGLTGRVGLALRGFFVSRKLRSFFENHGFLRGDYIREKGFSFQEIRPHPGRFTYLEGFWQSSKYFDWNRQRIIKDFRVKADPSGENAELLRRIKSSNSVCLHVRLGDYVSSKITSSAHGNLTAGYYSKALKKVARLKGPLRYYLFSDEPGKAIGLFGRGLKLTVVSHNQGLPHEDLRLMSACKYFITANSSFSWWAAWLSQRPGKRVVAPQKWFAGLGHDTKDLIPKEWARV